MYITVFYYKINRLIALSWCVLHKIKKKICWRNWPIKSTGKSKMIKKKEPKQPVIEQTFKKYCS